MTLLRRQPASALALAFLLASALPAAEAGDLALGRQKAAACAVCHGPQGLSVTPDAPNLAGQPALYLASQLRAYRSGARRHEVMAVIAKPLDDEAIAELAAWYAAHKISVQSAP